MRPPLRAFGRVGRGIICAPRRGASHPSGASDADGEPSVLEDDRHLEAAGELDHAVELLLVLLDVEVSDRVLALRVVLTGRGRVGSGVLAEDLDGFRAHAVPPSCHDDNGGTFAGSRPGTAPSP